MSLNGRRDGVKPARDMFSRLAQRYDLVNTLVTWGRDGSWRREAARLARPPAQGLALDVATGTGRLALDLARRTGRVVALDFCPQMLERGLALAQARGMGERMRFLLADARELPFPQDTFDCATSGFALRHMPDLPQALAELRRVLKPGCPLVCLELAVPRSRLLRLIYGPYFHRVVPFLGGKLSGLKEDYLFLPRSVDAFPPVEEVARTMAQAGFRDVEYKGLHLGAAAIHTGWK